MQVSAASTVKCISDRRFRCSVLNHTCNVMFVIFSHREANHHRKTLKKELLAAGDPSGQLFVKYGYTYPDCYHAGSLVSHTKICMYSYKYKILPVIHETLQSYARKPDAVILYENNAVTLGRAVEIFNAVLPVQIMTCRQEMAL